LVGAAGCGGGSTDRVFDEFEGDRGCGELADGTAFSNACEELAGDFELFFEGKAAETEGYLEMGGH
jgi:hypothetical protein